jgi:hypothetical protein
MIDFSKLTADYSDALEKTLSANNSLRDVIKQLLSAREELIRSLGPDRPMTPPPMPNICSICNDRKQTRAINCGHCFCNTCCSRVMTTGPAPRCPVCRGIALRTIRVYLD